jgi:hypothetical protein
MQCALVVKDQNAHQKPIGAVAAVDQVLVAQVTSCLRDCFWHLWPRSKLRKLPANGVLVDCVSTRSGARWLLTLFEWYRNVTVGQSLKSPQFPWILLPFNGWIDHTCCSSASPCS